MSNLLKNAQVKEALFLLDISDPEMHSVYADLLRIYSCAEPYLTVMQPESKSESVWIDTIKMHYRYHVGGDPRRSSFVISNQHQISQIFLFIIFMVKGEIDHRSCINLDKETPIFLIRKAREVIEKHTP